MKIEPQTAVQNCDTVLKDNRRTIIPSSAKRGDENIDRFVVIPKMSYIFS